MVNPTGYTALDLIGYTDKGPYAANVSYVKNDLVHYGGNIWRILIDDTIGITPAEGPNYTLFIGEPINLIERIIAPLEDNPATVAYQTGRQIIYNDHLYEVIQNIAVGDILIAYEDDPTNANIKLASPVETQVLALNASKVNKSDVVNNVTTTTAGKVLDARQGKALQDGINTKVNKSDIANNVTTTTAGKVLDARQGKTLQDGINTKINKSDIANNTTTTAEGKVLDARQGKALQDDIDDLQTAVVSVSQKVSGSGDAYSASKAYAVGDLVIHDNDLYKCITACSAAAWSVNQSCFSQTTLVSEIDDKIEGTKQLYNYNYAATLSSATPTVSLPSDWLQAEIIVTLNNESNYTISQTIIHRNHVFANNRFYRFGFYTNSGLNGSSLIRVNGNEISIINAYKNTTEVTSNSPVHVYYTKGYEQL